MSGKSEPKLSPGKIAENYAFPPSGPLENRVFKPPDILMDFLKDFDKDYIKPEAPYTAYYPSPSEMKEIQAAFAVIPPAMKKVIEPRFIGLFFVKNFASSGLTDFVFSKSGVNYYIMIINPKLLTIEASKWMTEKEKSIYINDDPTYSLNIDIGTGMTGFYYILMHEMTHVYDYCAKITPGEPEFETAKEYVKSVGAGAGGGMSMKYPFISGIWNRYKRPAEAYDFDGRDKITYYGLNYGPKIKISDSVSLYERLEKTPFVTLYGAQSWMEDLAEFSAAYIHIKIMKKPWVLTIKKDGKIVYQYRIDFNRENLGKRVEYFTGLLAGK